MIVLSVILIVIFIAPAVQAPPQESFAITASWYNLNGSLMANGEIFQGDAKHQAAHKTLKLGTKLRVTNPLNDRSLDVVINDRGPYIKGRDLDLPLAAAKYLDYVDVGITRLTARIIE